MARIKVLEDPELVLENATANSDSFALTSIRCLATDYYQATLAEPVTNGSFIITVDGAVCCIGMITSNGSSVNFMGLPARIEFRLANLEEQTLRDVAATLASLLKGKLKLAETMVVELPVNSRATELVLERLLPHASRAEIVGEARMSLLGSPGTVEGRVSKQARRDIRRAANLLDRPTVWFGAVEATIFEQFKALHLSAAGRRTRSSESWHLMKAAVLAKKASLTTVSLQGELVGGTFCWLSPKAAYYGTGAYDRSKFSDFPVSHWSVVEAMVHAQRINREIFILGDAYSISGTSKQKGISRFKRSLADSLPTFVQLELRL